MRAVPNVLATALEPARERDLDLGLDRPPEEGLRRLSGAAEPDLVLRHEVSPFGLAEDDDGARGDDRQLLARDRLTRRTEDLGVLERDVRQQHDPRVEDVRRVEPSAEPRLDDRHVHSCFGELGQRRSRQRLELGRADTLCRAAHVRDRVLEVRILPADLDPLAPAADVRRDIGARDQPFGPQQRRDHPRSRRLAVRAHNVDRRIGALRLAELGEERAHPPQSELLGPGRQALDPGMAGGLAPGRGSSSHRGVLCRHVLGPGPWTWPD